MKDASTQILIQFSPLCPHWPPSPPQWSYSLTQAATLVRIGVAPVRFRQTGAWKASPVESLVQLSRWAGLSAHGYEWSRPCMGNSGGDKSVQAIAVLVTVHAAVGEKKCTPAGVRVCFDAQKRACWMPCECMLLLVKFHQTVEVFFNFFFFYF